jgi:hypothetical protein
MSTRYDICTPRKGKDDKTFWTRIGTAWQSDKGIQLVFDALPLPDSEGRCVANLFEPKPRDSGGQQNNRSSGQNNNFATDDLGDDSIPF